MNQTTVSGNSAKDDGGGIYAKSSANITASTITENSTSGTSGDGGGIFSKSSLWIDHTTISGNASSSGGGGIYCLGSAQITDSKISYNSADDRGGGLNIRDTGSLSLTRTVVSDNSAYLSGGGIVSAASATIAGCVVTGNQAYAAGGITCGGVLMIRDSRITGNSATGSNGGGIISSGALSLINSTVNSNEAAQDGGGAYCYGDVSVGSSTISNNIASRSGGGIAAVKSVNLSNSTVSLNTAASSAGGVWCRGSSATISQSTIYRNQSSGVGGGVFMESGALSLNGSIVAGNFAQSGTDATGLLGASIQARFSLIGNNSGSGLAPAPVGSPDANGNLIGGATSQTMIDPKLGPLADNGGPTRTHAVLPGSPALNTGDPNANGLSQFDQRGAPFARVFSGRIDMGAYERQTLPFTNYVVDTLADENDGDISSGHLSLREAIGLANGDAGSAQTITFAPFLNAQGAPIIVLTHDELTITDSLTINGPGDELLTIDASGNDTTTDSGNGSRLFSIDDGDISTKLPMSISGLALTGGDITDGGGAILSQEDLTVEGSTIHGNYAGSGGGIYSFGPLALTDCIVSGNTASGSGGGILNLYANTTLTGCTITDNSALQGDGGAIRGFGSLTTITLNDSVLSDNSATAGFGGGIYTYGSVTLNNDVVSGNESQGGGGVLALRPITVTNSLIAQNVATLYSGGGLQAHGSVSVFGSTIVANSALSGSGGGIVAQGSVSVTNSTLSDNSAIQGGAIYCGGGTSSVTISFSTIVANVVTSPSGRGGGIFFGGTSLNALNLNGSIVAANSGPTGPDLIVGSIAKANITYSLIGDKSGTPFVEAPVGSPDAKGNLIGGPAHGVIDPMLGLLADNGGFMLPDGSHILTHALLSNSPALGAGNSSAVPGVGGVPVHDQRGVPFIRIYGGRIDMGAFELQPTDRILGDYNGDNMVDAADYYVWRSTVGSTTDLRADGNGDGVVDEADRAVWRANFGAMGEPESTVLAAATFSTSEAAVQESSVAERSRMASVGRTPVSVRTVRPLRQVAGAVVNLEPRDAALAAWDASTKRTSDLADHRTDAARITCPTVITTIEALEKMFEKLSVMKWQLGRVG
jgi:predicted outer membrane repeat protein/parallel beta-helix repeat protein